MGTRTARPVSEAHMTTGTNRSIINITPLIDILLVLMMIMMVITPITSRGLPAAVPETAKDQAPPAQPPIVLRIDRDSNIWLNRERLLDADFKPRLTQLLARRSDPVLFIDGAPELPFAAVAHLVDRARGLGFSRAAILPPTRH